MGPGRYVIRIPIDRDGDHTLISTEVSREIVTLKIVRVLLDVVTPEVVDYSVDWDDILGNRDAPFARKDDIHVDGFQLPIFEEPETWSSCDP